MSLAPPRNPGPGRRRRRGGGAERSMVPDATFASYYGRPIVKPSPWKSDIPAYIFLGGLAAGSSLLAAGADLSGRPDLRRSGRIAALAAVAGGTAALIHDLGKPQRFLNMLRVAKPTSPMSMGTWILATYGPVAGLAGAAELAWLMPRRFAPIERLLTLGARPAGLMAAALAPALASYTGVLLADTATPTWHAAHRELPFLFAASAASAAGGLGMVTVPAAQAGPARRLAVGGAAAELLVDFGMERRLGIAVEPLRSGTPGALMRASRVLNAAGVLGAILGGRRSPTVARFSGTALITASVCTRFAVFGAGQESARDPRYTVVPQRERLIGST